MIWRKRGWERRGFDWEELINPHTFNSFDLAPSCLPYTKTIVYHKPPQFLSSFRLLPGKTFLVCPLPKENGVSKTKGKEEEEEQIYADVADVANLR